MKKLALAVAVIMAFAAAPCAFAQDNYMREVLTSVKERIDVPAECTDFSSSSHVSEGTTYYQFNWNTPSGTEEYSAVSTTASGTGIITSFNLYKSGDYRTKAGKVIPLISKEQAVSAAMEFLARINPEQAAEYDFGQTTALLNDYRYNIAAPRVRNGIPTQDSVSIGINSQDGEGESLYMSYVENAVFPPIDDVISLEDAKEAFKNGAIEKIYSILGVEKKAEVVFSHTGFNYINAISGERLEPKDSDLQPYLNATKEMAAGMASYDSSARAMLTPEEVAVVEEVEGLLSAEEIEAGLREMPELPIEGLKRMNANLGKTDGKYIMSLSFENGETYCYISADAKTGLMLSMYGASLFEKPGAKQEEVYDEFVQSYYGDYLDNMILEDDGTRVRVVNGVKFPRNYIRAYKDADSGKLSNFSFTLSENIEFASTAATLDTDSAYEALYKAAPPELIYIWNGDTKEATPVYSLSFNYFNYIDGTSGLPINAMGEVQKKAEEKELLYSDISNHYAREAILALATIGVGFDGGAFEPDKIITQKEYATMVSKCIWNYEILRSGAVDFDATAKYVMQNGFIKEDEYYPDDPLSRELAVAILLRFMGYEQFASIEGIFRTDYMDETDISGELYGYVAIATGLKIVNGSGGYFNPKSDMTRGQAATVIYNYLKN